MISKFEIFGVSVVPVIGFLLRKFLAKIMKRRGEKIEEGILSTQIDQTISEVEKIRKQALRSFKKEPKSQVKRSSEKQKMNKK